MAQTLPVATYLCTINQEKTLSFLYQGGPGGSQKESLHILSTCSKFHYARTALSQQLTIKSLRAWQLPLANIWQVTGIFTSLSPLQLYFSQVGKSWIQALRGHGMPNRWTSDTSSENLVETCVRKMQAYNPFQLALQIYIASGWTVQVLLWVV